MPWKETRVVDQRMQVIAAHLGEGWAMSTLAREREQMPADTIDVTAYVATLVESYGHR